MFSGVRLPFWLLSFSLGELSCYAKYANVGL